MGFPSFYEDIQERINLARFQIDLAVKEGQRTGSNSRRSVSEVLETAKKQLTQAQGALLKIPPEAGARVQKINDLESENRKLQASLENLRSENKVLAQKLSIEEAGSKRLRGHIVELNGSSGEGKIRLESPLFAFKAPLNAKLSKGVGVTFHVYRNKRGQMARELRALTSSRRKKKFGAG